MKKASFVCVKTQNRLVDAECTKEMFYLFKVIRLYPKKNTIETC